MVNLLMHCNLKMCTVSTAPNVGAFEKLRLELMTPLQGGSIALSWAPCLSTPKRAKNTPLLRARVS